MLQRCNRYNNLHYIIGIWADNLLWTDMNSWTICFVIFGVPLCDDCNLPQLHSLPFPSSQTHHWSKHTDIWHTLLKSAKHTLSLIAWFRSFTEVHFKVQVQQFKNTLLQLKFLHSKSLNIETIQPHKALIISSQISASWTFGGTVWWLKNWLVIPFLSRHRATSTRATEATSPTSASPTATPTSSPWAGRTPASFSGGWWRATAGRDWPRPLPLPLPPALQILLQAR